MRGGEKRWEKGVRNKLKGNKHRKQKVKEGEGSGERSKWEEYMGSRRRCENLGRDMQ